MNHGRALRISTDTGLAIFLIMICGVVLWTTDEVLGWNILPDWIDKYAELLVIIFSILAAFSVVISIMCSLAVMAESAAEKAGILTPTRSRRARWLVTLGILLAFTIMFGLHKVDQYRAAKRAEARQQELSARYDEVRDGLNARMPEILALFSPEARRLLTAAASPDGDEAISRLLDAIEVSTPFKPSISVMVAAEAPYTHCVITPLPEDERPAQAVDEKFLRRQYLTGFPTVWEHEAVRTGFEAGEMDVPRDKSGIFIDTRRPSSWGTLAHDGRVIGIVMLRGSM